MKRSIQVQVSMATIEDFFEEKIKLPSPPAIALKILEAVRQDENSFDELARIISADPALTVRILKIANSSLYGFPNPVDSLSQATALIGTNALKNIALSFVIVQDFQDAPQGSFDLTHFWRRAITAAVAAETLAEEIGIHDQDLFVTALLQDIGVLLLYLSDTATYIALQDEKRVTGKTTSHIEQEKFGFDHSEVGNHLLATWSLPETIHQPILYHHADSIDGPYKDAAMILQFADKIAAIYHGIHSNSKCVQVHKGLKKQYRLTEEQTDRLIDSVGEKSHEILDLFSIDPGEIKPFSLIMQQANEELGRLNFSYAQIVLELKQAKQNAEQLALELKMANDSLRELAFRDGLTGLYNHRYFQEALESEIERARRYDHPLSLLMIDIDFFKKVNDQFGHPAGDQVLQEVGSTLVKLVRRCDMVARYGGEEFAIILPETGLISAKVLAQRVRRGIEQLEVNCGKHTLAITISCGISSSEGLEDDSFTRNILVEHSDKALYRAKENGRNRVEI